LHIKRFSPLCRRRCASKCRKHIFLAIANRQLSLTNACPSRPTSLADVTERGRLRPAGPLQYPISYRFPPHADSRKIIFPNYCIEFYVMGLLKSTRYELFKRANIINDLAGQGFLPGNQSVQCGPYRISPSPWHKDGTSSQLPERPEQRLDRRASIKLTDTGSLLKRGERCIQA